MANKKITDFTPMTIYADADVLAVVDVSEASPSDQNKKITKEVLFDSAPDFGNGFSYAGISSFYTAPATWTPVLEFGGATTGITYTIQTGQISKIGKTVIASGYIELTNKGSATGIATISGFPFTVGGTDDFSTPISVLPSNISFADMMVGFLNSSTGKINLEEITNAGTRTSLTDAEFTNTSLLIFSVSYHTA